MTAKKKGASGKASKNVTSASQDARKAADRLTVVGIGASAGGLEALEELFSNMPADTGMAFVIISHQSPGHVSLLPELLGKCTPMPAVEAADNVRLQPNHLYVAPPGKQMAVINSTLQVMDMPKLERPPLPIDYFFRSLAQDGQEHAICIVLSGTGSDGTQGLKAVKEEAGMVMAEDIRSARYAGMPASAIATKLVDYVLPPATMPRQLVAYTRALVKYGGVPRAEVRPEQFDQALQKIFVLLRSRTGHDFSCYKPTTMLRRIQRRMTLHESENAEAYVRLLQETPHEIDILFKELLIGVTSFFRDPEAFNILAEDALPALLKTRPEHYTFRAWIPGCGSGEEAYTMAIMLRECMHQLGRPSAVQIFATDLDRESIEVARAGRYPVGIAADVPAPYLQRYFTEEEGTYQVTKEIREMLVFATQNMIKDPPFTNIDLLSCRNLLIYLNPEVQKRLLPIFHYTLKPDGLLMLGPAETIGECKDLYAVVADKWKIFRRKEAPLARTLPAMPAAPFPNPTLDEPSADRIPPVKPKSVASQLEKFLLGHFTPPTVIVNDHGDIIYIHGHTGAYLEPGTGQPRLNIHEMAREGLAIELASAMRQVAAEKKGTVHRDVRVKNNGGTEYVDLSVSRITYPEVLRGLLLVTFQPIPPPQESKKEPSKKSKQAPHPDSPTVVEDLKREVQQTRESLQTTIEELETSNEELQSTNEELQSTNEELETSKEEMQSLNEELTTLNAELLSKLEELSRASDDMQNLLNSTNVATIFLDQHLHIMRFTEEVTHLINLIQTDEGRPLTDLATNFIYTDLAADAQQVLKTLIPKELEIETKEGVWHLVRLTPYRTTENVIDGVVITFVNIDEMKRAESALNQARQFFENIFNTIREPALVLDHELRVVQANQAFSRTFKTSPDHTEGNLVYELGEAEWDIPRLRKLLEEIIPAQSVMEDFVVDAHFPGLGRRKFSLNARLLDQPAPKPPMILVAMEDLTEGFAHG